MRGHVFLSRQAPEPAMRVDHGGACLGVGPARAAPQRCRGDQGPGQRTGLVIGGARWGPWGDPTWRGLAWPRAGGASARQNSCPDRQRDPDRVAAPQPRTSPPCSEVPSFMRNTSEGARPVTEDRSLRAIPRRFSAKMAADGRLTWRPTVALGPPDRKGARRRERRRPRRAEAQPAAEHRYVQGAKRPPR